MSASEESSELRPSPLHSVLQGAGGVFGAYHGRSVARHFGDPRGEYLAATEAVAVFDRSHRGRFRVTGSAPWQMLNGVLTGSVPTYVQASDEGGTDAGLATYHTVLTPKGRMITDLTAVLDGAETETGLLLDVPVAGLEGLRAHLLKVLPPRFAKVTDVSESYASFTLVGPGAAEVLQQHGFRVADASDHSGSGSEGSWTRAPSWGEVLAVRTMEVWPLAWTLYGPAESLSELWSSVSEAGAQAAGLGVWNTLRVEAGRPSFGSDLDEKTMPPEAGLVARAIDERKGCYTGQEVMVRIRDRGHVNRRLHRLLLGNEVPASSGAELLAVDGSGKVVGELRSVVESPKFGQSVGLGYVRRGVEEVSVGGRRVKVPEALGD